MSGEYTGPERRVGEATDQWRQDMTRRVTALEEGMATNTKLTQEVKANTDEIVSAFEAMKGAFTVAGWMGKFAKWVTVIVVAVGILYWAAKTGDLPRKG